jgi:hypothetical protein
MFLLPLIFLPFIFFMAINRLIRIPVALRRGELHVPVRRHRMLVVAGTGAYLLLLAYTASLFVAICKVILFAPDVLAAWLHLVGYVAAYPLVYLAAAWVFYYALKKRP